MAKTVWTGQSQKFTLTIGTICNHSHFMGHNTVVYYNSEGTEADVNGYVLWNPVGTKTTISGNKSYFAVTTDANSLVVNKKGASDYIEVKDDFKESKDIYFGTTAYFKGAKGELTFGDQHIATEKLTIYKTNSISNVTIGDKLYTKSSDTSAAPTALSLQYTSLDNAYNKTTTATVNDNDKHIATVGSTAATSHTVTVNPTPEDATFGTNGTATFTVTIDAADTDETIDDARYIRTATTDTITVYNVIDTVNIEGSTIYLNTGKGANDVGGTATFTAKTTASNGQKAYNPYYDVTGYGTYLKADEWSHLASGYEMAVTAVSGSGATAITNKPLTVKPTNAIFNVTETINYNISLPSASDVNLNVGESLDNYTLSDLAGNTYATTLVCADTTKVSYFTVAEGTTSNTFKLTANTPTDSTGLGFKWTTSDNATLYVGTIVIAAGIVVTIYKNATGTDVAADANFGDTLRVVVTGGTEDTTFNLTSNVAGVTFSNSTGVKSGDDVIITLPTGEALEDQNCVITATPMIGGAQRGTPGTNNFDLKHITFALS